jgi:hypothetical protein
VDRGEEGLGRVERKGGAGEVVGIPGDDALDEVIHGARELKVVFEIVAREFSGGEERFPVEGADFESIKTVVNGGIGGGLACMFTADVVDGGNGKGGYAGFEYSGVSSLPELLGVGDERISVEQDVEDNIGVEENAHQPCF